MSVLGIFPALDRLGGVERAGFAAWQAVSSGDPNGSHLITFGRGSPSGANGSVYPAVNKIAAIRTVVSHRWPTSFALIWHVGLLKLLPFVRPRPPRVIVFLHGIEVWRRLDLFTRRILRGVDLFLSNSEYTWRRFIANNPEFEWFAHRVVHLGVGTPSSAPAPPSDIPSAVMIGRAARSEAYKGHLETIAAWRMVRAEIPQAQLHIVGPCDMSEALIARARTGGVGDAVHIHGPVSEERKQELLAASRCMALPSRGEGFGLVYPESMRMGRPCLVSDCDAGREVVNPPQAGLAVDPGNTRQVADALCRLLSPGREWDQWSVQSRARYAACYTEAHFQSRLLAAIGESV